MRHNGVQIFAFAAFVFVWRVDLCFCMPSLTSLYIRDHQVCCIFIGSLGTCCNLGQEIFDIHCYHSCPNAFAIVLRTCVWSGIRT